MEDYTQKGNSWNGQLAQKEPKRRKGNIFEVYIEPKILGELIVSPA